MQRLVPIRTILSIALVAVLLWAAHRAITALLLLAAAIILAAGLDGAARALKRHLPGGRKPWLLGILLVGIGSLVGLGFWLGPMMAKNFGNLRTSFMGAVESVTSSSFFQDLLGDTGSPTEMIAGHWASVLDQVSLVAMGLVNVVSALVLIVVLTLFLVWNPRLYRHGILSLFPRQRRERYAEVLDAVGDALWHWMIGQAFAMTLIGLLTGIALWLVGMEFALLLGVIAGVLQFIPYVGPFLSAVPGVTLALAESPRMALIVGAVYLGVQIVEGNFITPFVLKSKASLPPVLTLISTVAFGLIFGPLGLIIATPLSLMLLVIYRQLYPELVLHEPRPVAETGDFGDP